METAVASTNDIFFVRSAKEEDAQDIWQLMGGMSETERVSEYFGKDGCQLASDIATGSIKCFIAEHICEQRAVGFCIASFPYCTRVGQFLFITAVFVLPEFRRQQLCTALVTCACRFARDVLKTTRVVSAHPVINAEAAATLSILNFTNVTLTERWLSYRLDAAGLRLALKSELRPGIRLDGFGDIPGTRSATYVVRPAIRSDCEHVILLKKEMRDFHGFEKNKMILTADRLREDLQNGLLGCAVAMETKSQRVIGMAASYRYLSIEFGMMAHLRDVILMPEYRGQGLGRALIVSSCLWAASQGASTVDLRVADWNSSAQAAFKAMGFEDDAVKRPVTDFVCADDNLERLASLPLPAGVGIESRVTSD